MLAPPPPPLYTLLAPLGRGGFGEVFCALPTGCLHCAAGRQHSLAYAELSDPTGCNHLMVEVDSVDEVGRALDRVDQNGVRLTLTLGRHVNDDMISFYMMTPGGFQMEYGTGGSVKDWSNYKVFESTRGSHWGHKFLGAG